VKVVLRFKKNISSFFVVWLASTLLFQTMDASATITGLGVLGIKNSYGEYNEANSIIVDGIKRGDILGTSLVFASRTLILILLGLIFFHLEEMRIGKKHNNMIDYFLVFAKIIIILVLWIYPLGSLFVGFRSWVMI